MLWLVIKSRNWSHTDVGLTYDRCLHHRELWRIVTSQLSHIDLLHLIFNASSTWSMRSAEAQGSLHYVHTSLLLMLISAGVRDSGGRFFCM